MHPPLLKQLYAHMEWADAFVRQAVVADDGLSEDDFVTASLFHLHMAQRAWLSVWKGEEFAVPSRDDFATLDEIRDWARSYHVEVAGFVEQLMEPGLAEVIEVPWREFVEREIGGPMAPTRLVDSALQVAMHSIHHRAQINRRIRELGRAPGMVDYIGWVWRGEPRPEWPE